MYLYTYIFYIHIFTHNHKTSWMSQTIKKGYKSVLKNKKCWILAVGHLRFHGDHWQTLQITTIMCDSFIWVIGLVGRVSVNSLGDLGSIPAFVIPKTLKMVLDTSLLNTQQYKVRIKSKVEQSRKKSSALHYTSV